MLHCFSRKRLIGLMAALAALLGGAPSSGARTLPGLVAADNRFGFALFRQLARDDARHNVFLSPAGAALALQMAYVGASGETLRAMGDALALQGMSPGEVGESAAALLDSLKSQDNGVVLDVANSVWVNPGLVPRPDYARTVGRCFNAKIGSLAGAPANVNAWVRRATHGCIPSIMDRSDTPQLAAAIVDVVYFKGTWARKFAPDQTADQRFVTAQSGSVVCRMMKQSGKYAYFGDDRVQAIRLPYGNGSLAMELLLPAAGTDFGEFVQGLTLEKWDKIYYGLVVRDGEIGVPKLKFERSMDLNKPLIALGMGVVFDRIDADFGQMFDLRRAWIERVKQKTLLEVDETGTEAAAATSVTIHALTRRRLPFGMILDHPFVFAIRDMRTAALLFLGAVVNPAPEVTPQAPR